MFLTAKELLELTEKVRCDRQREVLNHLGIEHKVRPDGSLVVLRAYVERQFGLAPRTSKKPTIEPDWSNLNDD